MCVGKQVILRLTQSSRAGTRTELGNIHSNRGSCHLSKQSRFEKLQVACVPDPEKMPDDQLTAEMWGNPQN